MNNYYILNREYIIKKNLEYYYKNKEMINQRNKQYFFNYYRQNKENIIKRVQNNYYSKVHAIKVYKPVIIHKQKNNIIKNNIVISLMD
jgi:hypothetical protein